MLLLAFGSTRQGKIPRRIFSTTGYDSQLQWLVAGALELLAIGFEQPTKSARAANAKAEAALPINRRKPKPSGTPLGVIMSIETRLPRKTAANSLQFPVG